MHEIADVVHDWVAAGWRAVFARCFDGDGNPGCGSYAVNELGESVGRLPGAGVTGSELEAAMMLSLAVGPPSPPVSLTWPAELLTAGPPVSGEPSILLQVTDGIPLQFWTAVARAAPVGLATVIAGATAARSRCVLSDASCWGSLGSAELDRCLTQITLGVMSEAILGALSWSGNDATVLVEVFNVPRPVAQPPQGARSSS